jgi:gamma-glutamyltranspeptidase/glutathione hydrolase
LLVRVLSTALFLIPSACAQTAAEYRDHAKVQHAEVPQDWPTTAVRSTHGMVATDEQLASQVGVEIMKRGGNAIDAAVAVAFALAVVEPAAGNIGGGGFMLVRLADGRNSFLDYREVAPGRATRNMYIGADGKVDNDASTVGPRSIAVPGTVAGLALALKLYGTMKLADILAPAIHLAETGFPVNAKMVRELGEEQKDLQRFAVSRRIFLRNGNSFRQGELFQQPELAATLRRIAKSGPDDFYRGETAHIVVADLAKHGGIITPNDLAKYQPRVREALRAKYDVEGHRWEVLTSPPPSSGGVAIIESLNMLEKVALKNWDDITSVHIVAETMRRVFADRAAYLADPDYAKIPVDGLTALCYAEERASTIDTTKASSSTEIKAGTPHICGISARTSATTTKYSGLSEGPHTTHFSVVDAAGNAVASTFTLNDSYGSHFTSAAGFLLNDEMDDFTTQPGVPNALFGLVQSDANAIAPGHRPLSSMVPTILLRDGQLSFVTGSPGGPTIISATLLTILNWMRFGMDAQAAINAPRFHHQWLPDRIEMEEEFPPAMESALNVLGHKTKRKGHIGLVNAIGIDPQNGERLGAADPRDHGSAIGY